MSRPITLNPQDYPSPEVTMLSFVPANITGTLELGPGFLDAETVQELADAVMKGTFTLAPEWEEPLSRSDADELERRFLERLRRTPLGHAAPALHHRRLALFEAIREIGADGSLPGFGFGVHNLTRCIGDVETWLEGKRQELLRLGLQDLELARQLGMLTPKELAALLQVTEATLSQWRESNRGPAYAQLSARTIRYPVIAVLEWLRGEIGR